MKIAELPLNETARVKAVQDYCQLGEGDPVLDKLTELVAAALNVPIALVTIVESQRQWFKSRFGYDITETSRDVSFCAHTVRKGSPLVVPDALEDPRFFDNPLVLGYPRIRFYAGAPLNMPDGTVLGTVCAIDTQSRTPSNEQHVLELCATQAVAQLLRARKERDELARQLALDGRARASAAEQHSEAKFRALVASAPVGMFEVDAKGRCTYVNDRWIAMTGIPLEQALGDGWARGVHPEDREKTVRHARQARLSGEPFSFHFRFISPTKKELFVWAQGVPLRDEHGAISGYLGAMVDLTEQRAAEQALAKSEEGFRMLAQRAPIGIGVRVGSTIVYANPALARLHGLESPEQLLGRDATEGASPSDRGALEERVSRSARGEPVPPDTVKLQRADGTEIKVEIDSINVEFGGRLATMSLIRDVTELERAQKERDAAHAALLESLGQKETLLKEIHHRVKNNLQVIASLLRLGRDYVADAAALDVFNDSIARVHSIALIHERLYQSKDLDKIDLANYFEGLVTELVRANTTHAPVAARIECEHVFLDVDRCVPIGLIVNELATNALKHAFEGSPRQPDLLVSLVERNDDYELIIQDNGIGLTDGSPREDSLGLMLVSNLVRQLRGKHAMEQANGTRWRIVFPKPDPSQD